MKQKKNYIIEQVIKKYSRFLSISLPKKKILIVITKKNKNK